MFMQNTNEYANNVGFHLSLLNIFLEKRKKSFRELTLAHRDVLHTFKY